MDVFTPSSIQGTHWLHISNTAQFNTFTTDINIIAIEAHAPESSPEIPLDFDMTLLFPEYEPTTYILSKGSIYTNCEPSIALYDIKSVIDNSLYTYYYTTQWNTTSSYIQYDSGKEILFYVNQYTLQFGQNQFSTFPTSWILEGSNDEYSWTELDRRSNILINTQYNKYTVSMKNVVAYRYYRFYFTALQSGLSVGSLQLVDILLSAQKITAYCEAYNDFPSVPAGTYSRTSCQPGYSGLMKAYCDPLTNSFMSFDFVDCKLNRPSNLEYPSIVYEFILHIPISPIVPSVVGIVHRYAMYNALPEGLVFHTNNGTITGIPTVLTSSMAIKIYAENDAGPSNMVILYISVNQPFCRGQDGWDTTEMGETTIKYCSDNSSIFQKRKCQSSATPTWGPIEGDCKSNNSLSVYIGVGIGIFAFFALLIVIFCLWMRYKHSQHKKIRKLYVSLHLMHLFDNRPPTYTVKNTSKPVMI